MPRPPRDSTQPRHRQPKSRTGIAPLGAAWRALLQFAASYYQRSIGEVAVAALPPQLREIDAEQLQRRLKRHAKAAKASAEAPPATTAPPLSPEQAAALEQIDTQPGPFLLFGTTGSGKTEV